MINRERLIKRFTELVQIDSVSRQEGKLAQFLREEFSRRGFEVLEDQAKDKVDGNAGNLLVRIPGNIPGPALLFSGHMDTVEPGIDIVPVIADDCIRSSGTTILGSDDKAAIAAVMEALDVIMENRTAHTDLEMLFTVCEEQGLLGAKAFDYRQLKAEMGFVLDAGDEPGSIVIASPCQNEIEYRVYGKAAHAGMNPEDGVNAIHVAAEAISIMPCGRIDEETTCNIGMIAGGKARNIVADSCRVLGEARSLKRDKLDRLTAELEKAFISTAEEKGARAEVEVNFLYPEIQLGDEDPVVQAALKAAQSIGLEGRLVKTGGGSDASIINGNGIPCVNLGVGMRNVHTVDEYIKIEDLVNDARLVLALIQTAVR